MAIFLDFVGLNTLVHEPVDSDTNTIGFKKIGFRTRKALRRPDTASSTLGIISGQVQSTYPSEGYLSLSFWVKLDTYTVYDAGVDSHQFIVEADEIDNQYAIVLYVQAQNPGTTMNAEQGQLVMRLAGGTTTGGVASEKIDYVTEQPVPLNKWTNIVININMDEIEESPEVYFDKNQITTKLGAEQDGTGSMLQIQTDLALMGQDDANVSNELKGSMQDFAFYNKQLTEADREVIYESVNLYNTDLTSDMIDYWLLGDESEFSSFSSGDSVPVDTVFAATVGSTSLTTKQDVEIAEGYFNYNLPGDVINTSIVGLNANDYQVALNIRRNGPYGHASFRQTRTSTIL